MKPIMLRHVPPDWSIERLGQLFTERKEKVSDKDCPSLSVTKSGVVPQMAHVAKTNDGDNRKKVCVGDFVINSRSDRKGSSGLSSHEGSVSLINIVLEPRHGNPRFLHHLLKSDAFQEEFYRFGHGIVADLWTTRYSELKGIRVAFPDLKTQKRIADFLDRETALIDQLIEKREAFLHLIAEKRVALSTDAINGEILGGTHDGERGWFGYLPKDWSVQRAKFLFRERQNRSEAGHEDLLTVSHITGVTLRANKDVNMFLAESMEGYKMVARGDVVVNTMWAWMGAMGVSPVEGLISPSYGIYTSTVDAFEPKYLDLLLRSLPFIAEVNRRSKGVWSSRLRLYPDAFLNIRLPVPTKQVQRTILEALHSATEREDRLANLSRRSIVHLRELRSALITAAVTGQIDVEHWRKRGNTERCLEAVQQESNA